MGRLYAAEGIGGFTVLLLVIFICRRTKGIIDYEKS
jgi:hypothetical protein